MIKSMQWKIVLVYSLLILFAMQFFAVFLTQSLERYYLNTFSTNLESQGLLLANFLERHLVAGDDGAAIDGLVREYSRYAGITEIMVLDAFGRVISSSRAEDELRGQRIVQDETIRALTGSKSEETRLDPETRERFKYLALPVRSGDKILGVVYLIGSLEPIYATLREIQFIFLTGALLVLAVTILLGVALAKTISGPIREVTSKAAQIARGDFRQRIEVRSQDEIGHLGEMFNYLSCQLEETLREISSEKGKVEAILNHMTDGILALNSEGQLLHVNPAARKLLRVAGGEEPGHELVKMIAGGVNLPHLLESGIQQSREIVLDAHKCLLQAYFVPFLTPDAPQDTSFSGVLVVLHDITKERELARIQQEFVANVSHELRTPLTTIKSYTDALLGGAMRQPEVCLSFLTTMERETDRMVRLVKDLLVLSQLDYQQVSWGREERELNQLVAEVVAELKVKYYKKGRRLSVRIPQAPVVLAFDRDKLKQVLLNVIQNAYKYTGPGGNITVALESDGKTVKVSVSDDGIGIPAEDLDKVFERFYRVDKGRSRELGGTGLGLSIAREIVEAHGGSISIDSKLNRGTEVVIMLPGPAADKEEKRHA
ncbi:MAG: HAMP domain-containing protein [Dethiobacter sp.]|jgi:two-component system sensor histidine kinase VicK|nr:HAMP domain-containing protein [Dethiobacter sp.]